MKNSRTGLDDHLEKIMNCTDKYVARVKLAVAVLSHPQRPPQRQNFFMLFVTW